MSTTRKDVRVTCITKPDRDDRHDSITHIGGSTWKWTREQAIADIESPTEANRFYTQHGNNTSTVGVVTPQNGRKYLRTYADGQWNDNLLALDECS